MTLSTTEHLRKCLIICMVAVQVVFYPGVAFAQVVESDAPSAEAAQTSQSAVDDSDQAASAAAQGPAPGATGPQAPTGADSKTYTKNPDTGLWENDHYTWDPVSKQTAPKQSPTYSFNPTTGKWDTTQWYYSPEQGKYVPNIVSSDVQPSAAAARQSTITNTGPNSTNTIGNTGDTNIIFNGFYNAAISNSMGQISRSGDASVVNNGNAGSALTGDALALMNVLNMIQSSWGSLGSSDLALFMANIDGDVVGDLYVDPNALAARPGNTNVDLNVSSSAAIANDITVDVQSGDATVSNNTSAGDATTGNAHAVVNLLNLINSAITSGKSFMGVLNINGNLDGDILLPPEMMQAIIAATGPGSTNQVSNNSTANYNIDSNDNKAINNTVTTNANSGAANVSGNTTAGSATTGDASSNVVLLNLTGKKVVAKNAMLVFVNVLGSWVGLIYDAPAGTNAVAVTGAGSTNTINNDRNLTVDADITKDSLITNNVTVDATSGDANVTGNTNAGNATSGDALIGVNILNMIDSEFQIDDWFGVLFINVFGKWYGSFGIDTDAGTIRQNGSAAQPSSDNSPATAGASSDPGVFSFVPRAPGGAMRQAVAQQYPDGEEFAAANVMAAIANDSSQTDSAKPAQNQSSPSSQTASGQFLLAGIVTIAGVLMLGGERIVAIARSRFMA